MCYTSVKWYLQGFFHFVKILIFQVVSCMEGQKMAQNDKKFCLSCSISQEPGVIWFLFIVYMYKIISPGIFWILSKSWFSKLLGGWKGKKWSKMTKNSVCSAPYLRNQAWYGHCVTQVENGDIASCFFHFLRYWFLRLLGGEKGEKWPRMTRNLVAPYISGTLYNKIFIYGTHL